MELTKTKLHRILKKYRLKLEQYNKNWDSVCKKRHKVTDLGNDRIEVTRPSIYDHEKHNSEGANLFKELISEFDIYEIFPKKENTNSKRIKSLFVTYFDGCYGVDAEPNTPSTYSMGVCKLEYKDKENELVVHLRRPGLLIGKGGRTIDTLAKHLNCKVDIVEVSL